MRVLLINEVFGTTSTGKICAQIAEEMDAEGHEVKVAFGRWPNVPERYQKYAHYFGSDFEVKLHGIQTRLFDIHGFGSKHATREFLKWAEEYKPDLLWLHNLHGYYINVELLFAWIKQHPEMQVKWTLHDCWAFTGHCSYFTMVKCEQWKEHCVDCPQLRRYPACYLHSSVKKNFERKCVAFTGVKNMTIITPSQWLADLVKQSFLKEYPVEVHYNTIDTNVFKPTPSDFRERYGLQNKIVVLGVANVWEERKGLFDFYKLAEMLDNRYVIVLVGLSEKQVKDAPKKIVNIERVNEDKKLAEIYTADILVNPSIEETFGMTPVETKACGTPSIVYKGTACEEITCINGSKVVPQNINALYEAITGMKFSGGERRQCLIISVPRTNSMEDLAKLYTTADCFVNPTYEDNYPTVNLEAKACGTAVITYDTGGCKETLR